MNVTRWRKRPVEVEAVQVSHMNYYYVAEWVQGAVGLGNAMQPVVLIHTLEGTMTAQIGDYIIKGVQGEFYPCKPDIFEATYERVEP